MTTTKQRRILLWAAPRSLSTAMCRVMMNSGLTTQILFEPYSGSYYFGPERISSRYQALEPNPKYSYENAKKILEMPYEDKELVFVKDMAYALTGRMKEEWIPDGYTHAFIIRHPKAAVASFFKLIHHAGLPEWTCFDMAETGYREQAELSHLLQKLGHKIIVIDADDLLNKTEATLRAYCREVGLDFSSQMLDWKPISAEEFRNVFGEWEPAWFGYLRSTSTIARPTTNQTPSDGSGRGRRPAEDPENNDEQEAIVAECLPFYDELRKICLQI